VYIITKWAGQYTVAWFHWRDFVFQWWINLRSNFKQTDRLPVMFYKSAVSNDNIWLLEYKQKNTIQPEHQVEM